MSEPSRQQNLTKSTTRVPHSFFYDRLVPMLLATLAVVLVIVVALVIGALAGVIPIK